MRRIALIIALAATSPLFLGCAGTRIDGTYVLVSRTLPDGTAQLPPMVQGLTTFGEGMRQTDVFWKDVQGRGASVSEISEFRISEYAYSETNVYRMENIPAQQGLSYDLSDVTSTSEIVYTERGMRFDLPLHNGPRVEFTDDGFTATRAGEFVDRWRKVKHVRNDEAKARAAEQKAAQDAKAAEERAANDAAIAEEPQK